MARVFSIYFTYEEELYSAIVSIQVGAVQTAYTLGNIDNELRLQLPGTRIVTSTSGQLVFENAALDQAKSLMTTIIASLNMQLQRLGASP